MTRFDDDFPNENASRNDANDDDPNNSVNASGNENASETLNGSLNGSPNRNANSANANGSETPSHRQSIALVKIDATTENSRPIFTT